MIKPVFRDHDCHGPSYTHPELKHGKVRVAFTPDEEIGRGPHKFDVTAFDAVYAYTMDGGPLGELQYESFNAAAALITCKGKNVHPGTAKGKMINAAKIAMELHGSCPLMKRLSRPRATKAFTT